MDAGSNCPLRLFTLSILITASSSDAILSLLCYTQTTPNKQNKNKNPAVTSPHTRADSAAPLHTETHYVVQGQSEQERIHTAQITIIRINPFKCMKTTRNDGDAHFAQHSIFWVRHVQHDARRKRHQMPQHRVRRHAKGTPSWRRRGKPPTKRRLHHRRLLQCIDDSVEAEGARGDEAVMFECFLYIACHKLVGRAAAVLGDMHGLKAAESGFGPNVFQTNAAFLSFFLSDSSS